MARSGVDYRQFRQFQEAFEQELTGTSINKFMETSIKRITVEFLSATIKKTPVGIHKYKQGGTLRRGWVDGNYPSLERDNVSDSEMYSIAKEFMNNVNVIKSGNSYEIIIHNNVEYAAYVEYGHRNRNHTDYIEGQKMMTKSEEEVQRVAHEIIEDLFIEKMRNTFGGIV